MEDWKKKDGGKEDGGKGQKRKVLHRIRFAASSLVGPPKILRVFLPAASGRVWMAWRRLLHQSATGEQAQGCQATRV